MSEASQGDESHEMKAFRIARQFWYSFVQKKLRPKEKCLAGQEPVSAMDISRELFDRSKYSINLGVVNDCLQEMLAHAPGFRGKLIEEEEVWKETEPVPMSRPLVVFHPVSKESITSSAMGENDREAIASQQIPASWIFQKRFGKGFIPCIAVDRDCINTFLRDTSGRALPERNLLVLRIILHELAHFILHWRTLLPAALPNIEFHFEWANEREEEEAWIVSHSIMALAVSAIAHSSRSLGQFDSAWQYP